MKHLITSGNIGYIIVGLTVLEIAGLVAYRRLTGNGLTLSETLPNILAGDFILLAWPLSPLHWMLSALCLLCALFSHSADILRRWQSR